MKKTHYCDFVRHYILKLVLIRQYKKMENYGNQSLSHKDSRFVAKNQRFKGVSLT